MIILVPMAGRGSRFQVLADQNLEYKNPKPLITIKGKLMVEWAVKSLPKEKVQTKKLFFICLEEQQKQYKIVDVLKKTFGKDIGVLFTPRLTRGALETALIAKKYINTDEDILISDSDHYFDGESLFSMIEKKDAKVQGIIPVFHPPDDEVKWSYTLFDRQKRALAVGEKDAALAAKGAYANIGAYYFTHGNVFVKEAEEMIVQNVLSGPEGRKEFFVAPLYQRMIEKKMKIQAAITQWMWGLGTPKDVEYFLKNHM